MGSNASYCKVKTRYSAVAERNAPRSLSFETFLKSIYTMAVAYAALTLKIGSDVMVAVQPLVK